MDESRFDSLNEYEKEVFIHGDKLIRGEISITEYWDCLFEVAVRHKRKAFQEMGLIEKDKD